MLGGWMWVGALVLAGCAANAPFGARVAEAAAPQAAARAPGGRVVELGTFASASLSRERRVWAYLPPGYDAAPAKRYPVVYAHDGNNVFDAGSAFGGAEWQLDESMDRLIAAGEAPAAIVVGVGNTADRTAEYTWLKGTYQGETLGGRGADYARFLVSELKPAVDRRLRTQPAAASTSAIGSSLGGLINLYLARHHSKVFGAVAAMSPSVWWADRGVLAEIPRLDKKTRLYVDVGGQEGSDPQAFLADARALKAAIVQRGYAEGTAFRYVEDAPGGHNEKAWAYRAPGALRFLLGG